MSIFAYIEGTVEHSSDAFEDMDVMLERELRGVAALQDSRVVNGFGQWVIGRSND